MRHFILVPCVLAIHLAVGPCLGWTEDGSDTNADVIPAKGEVEAKVETENELAIENGVATEEPSDAEKQTTVDAKEATVNEGDAQATGLIAETQPSDSEIMLCSGCDTGCDGCLANDCDSGCNGCQTMPGEITERLSGGGCDDCQSELSRLNLKTMSPSGSSCCDGGCDTCSCFRPGRLMGGILHDGIPCLLCGACDACDSCDSCDSCNACEGGCRTDCCNYASFFGGWNILRDYDGVTPAPPTDLRGTFSDGWGFGLACGRRLRNCYRAELEFSYRRNTGEDWIVNGVPGRWSGDFNSYAGMANLYRDLPALDLYGCTPYVGGGIGFASLRSSLNTAATTILVDDFAFAFQFMAGTTKTIGERVDMFTEYRYFAPTEVDVTNIGVVPSVVLDSDRFDNHGLFFGLRYHY